MKKKKDYWIKRLKRKVIVGYFKDVDIFDVSWCKGKEIESSRELEVTLVADFNKKGDVVGLEIWDFGHALKESQKKIDKLFAKRKEKK